MCACACVAYVQCASRQYSVGWFCKYLQWRHLQKGCTATDRARSDIRIASTTIYLIICGIACVSWISLTYAGCLWRAWAPASPLPASSASAAGQSASSIVRLPSAAPPAAIIAARPALQEASGEPMEVNAPHASMLTTTGMGRQPAQKTRHGWSHNSGEAVDAHTYTRTNTRAHIGPHIDWGHNTHGLTYTGTAAHTDKQTHK